MNRGRHYSTWRSIADRLQRIIYGNGWAAEIAYALKLQGGLHIDEAVLELSKPASLVPLKVALLSDIHAGPLTHPKLLMNAVQRLHAAQPDLVLLGGDYISLDHQDLKPFAEMLHGLNPVHGVYGVLGNHDLWQNHGKITEILTQAGVRVLCNEEIRLPAPHGNILLYGMDDPGTGKPSKPAPLVKNNDIRLVLMHSPPGLRYLEAGHFHFALCGHTHGGQITHQTGKPIILPRGAGDRVMAGGGIFMVMDGVLLVSRGIGMSDLPIRLNARSEVHLYTIT